MAKILHNLVILSRFLSMNNFLFLTQILTILISYSYEKQSLGRFHPSNLVSRKLGLELEVVALHQLVHNK